jgi:hypothetical protein
VRRYTTAADITRNITKTSRLLHPDKVKHKQQSRNRKEDDDNDKAAEAASRDAYEVLRISSADFLSSLNLQKYPIKQLGY